MKTSIGSHIRSNAIGYVALFAALGGTAWAVNGPAPGKNTVGSADIIDEEVRSRDIGLGAVQSADVADDSTPNALSGIDIAEGSLTGSDIASESLSGEDISDGSLGSGDLLNGSIDASDIADGSLGGDDVTDESLSRFDVVNESLTGGDIDDGSLTGLDVQGNSLTGADILNGSLAGDDVQNSTLTGDDVGPDGLTGADIDESTLAQVPAAVLGGTGRSGASDFPCDPEDTNFTPCFFFDLTLPGQSRVLMIARTTADAEAGAENGVGTCHLFGPSGVIAGSEVDVTFHEDASIDTENVSMTGVTPMLSPGTFVFGISCNQGSPGAIKYLEHRLSVVALSPN